MARGCARVLGEGFWKGTRKKGAEVARCRGAQVVWQLQPHLPLLPTHVAVHTWFTPMSHTLPHMRVPLQDLGVIDLLRHVAPNLPVHGSTQVGGRPQ